MLGTLHDTDPEGFSCVSNPQLRIVRVLLEATAPDTMPGSAYLVLEGSRAMGFVWRNADGSRGQWVRIAGPNMLLSAAPAVQVSRLPVMAAAVLRLFTGLVDHYTSKRYRKILRTPVVLCTQVLPVPGSRVPSRYQAVADVFALSVLSALASRAGFMLSVEKTRAESRLETCFLETSAAAAKPVKKRGREEVCSAAGCSGEADAAADCEADAEDSVECD